MGEKTISKINLEDEQDIYVKRGMVRAEFNFWVGLVMDKFYDGLQNNVVKCFCHQETDVVIVLQKQKNSWNYLRQEWSKISQYRIIM